MSDEPQQYNLKWRNHRKNFFEELENLFKTDLLTDINLILEGGRVVPCHKMVLATTSLAFREFLLKNPEAFDMIIPGVTYDQMRTLLEYMYSGQAQIMYSQLSSLLKVAEFLKIKGLTSEDDGSNSPSSSSNNNTTSGQERNETNATEASASPPPTISTSTNDQQDEEPQRHHKPAESAVASSSSSSPPPPPPPQLAASAATLLDYYKYTAAYNMPAFPNLGHFPLPQYAAAMAVAASEYYGSFALDKLKDTPILRNVLHQQQHHGQDLSPSNSPVSAKDVKDSSMSRTNGGASSAHETESSGRRKKDEKPKTSPYYKVKKELMERVQQQQQQQQCQSTETTPTPTKTGKQKVDWKRYKQYSPDDLNRAITAVIDGEMSALRASQIFSVPSRTLYDKIKRLKSQRSSQNGTGLARHSVESDSACFPYGVGRNVNGRIYKKRSYSPANFSSLLTPENLSMMAEECAEPANHNASVCSDAMSNSSHSPPAWQQSTPRSEEDPARYNLSPAHSASSRQSASDCEMAEDLSVKKTPSNQIKQEIVDENSE